MVFSGSFIIFLSTKQSTFAQTNLLIFVSKMTGIMENKFFLLFYIYLKSSENDNALFS